MTHRNSFPLSDISNPDSHHGTAYSPVSAVEEDAGSVLHGTKESKGSYKCHLTISKAGSEPPPKPLPTFDRLFTNSWGLETLGWLCATLMLVVLIIILAIFDGKAVGEWHSGLTLNTIIQVITQMAQMTIILPVSAGISQLKWLWYHSEKRPLRDMQYFQEATTGPFGSLVLLWKRRTK